MQLFDFLISLDVLIAIIIISGIFLYSYYAAFWYLINKTIFYVI